MIFSLVFADYNTGRAHDTNMIGLPGININCRKILFTIKAGKYYYHRYLNCNLHLQGSSAQPNKVNRLKLNHHNQYRFHPDFLYHHCTTVYVRFKTITLPATSSTVTSSVCSPVDQKVDAPIVKVSSMLPPVLVQLLSPTSENSVPA
jgi:hypothetical protein